jgi:Ca2+-transporting ATPase
MHSTDWHSKKLRQLTAYWESSQPEGLSKKEAAKRLERIGPNALTQKETLSPFAILLEQFHDFMVLVLIGATVISFSLGEVTDAVTILAIVILNAVLGFFQEYRAERSLAALQELSAPRARVLRGGVETDLPADRVVPGDIVVLEAGDRVPADARLLESVNLACNEAALTGESQASAKEPSSAGLPSETPVGDRTNMVFAGTLITRGHGRALVTATGMQTEMGSIAGMIQETRAGPTPLQRRLDQLGKYLVAACLAVSAVVVFSGLLRGEPLFRMFLTGVSLAVAAIPEGLPAVVTIALAVGVERMIKVNVVVRKLHAVETLGCAQVICADKTGTLTQNKMTVRSVYTGGRMFNRNRAGHFLHNENQVAPELDVDLKRTLVIASLCNNEDSSSLRTRGGDPTERALLLAAEQGGLNTGRLHRTYPRTGELPFESQRRRMSVVVRLDNASQQLFPEGHGQQATARALLCKGAPATILDRCTGVAVGTRVKPLTPLEKKELAALNETLASRAERVLAVAYRHGPPGVLTEAVERQLVFVGFLGMLDPPRPEAKQALQRCRAAGMSAAMITGDQPRTAEAIARELGMLSGHQRVIDGVELDSMSDNALKAAVHSTSVFARVSPEHKLRLVRCYREQGKVVAMTGDGVNDAPAVREADIGVAMGQSGTDVTREASDMVLTDDNFASIVGAVEEGRGIYDNIRKFIRYLLACNTGEVLVMFLASLFRLPLPLLPIHILFVNLVTDGLPAIALGIDPNLDDVMDRPPRDPAESVFARGLARRIITRGTLIGVSTLVVFSLSLFLGHELARARTMALCTLVLSQLFHVFDCRSETRSILELGIFSNPVMVWAVLSSAAALVGAVYVPALQAVFNTTPLLLSDWTATIGAAALGGVLVALRRIYAVRR